MLITKIKKIDGELMKYLFTKCTKITCSPKHANCISGSISGRLDTAVGFIIIQNIFQLSTTKVVFEAPPSIMHQMNILIFLKGLVL